MNILMMTNTYTPLVGGIEASIESFSEKFRAQGHQVLIVAPEFEGVSGSEEGVVRVPAIRKFSGTDFSVNLPVPGLFSRVVRDFRPDVIHSHHPFLMGDIALRLCGQYHLPLVFTYHTMFERYVDYLPVHGEILKRFVVELAAGYANLADQVIVPSRNVYELLLKRGVRSPIAIIPTGVDVKYFQNGSRERFRARWGIPDDAFVIGYVGRLTPEKNLIFLSRALAKFLWEEQKARCVIVGDGPLMSDINRVFHCWGVSSRVSCCGILRHQDLVDSYHAMDVFAFSSQSETQGLVLGEAMAAGVPVVALDNPVVRECVDDFQNGRLIVREDEDEFIAGLKWILDTRWDKRESLKHAAANRAREVSLDTCAARMLEAYEHCRLNTVHRSQMGHRWLPWKDRLQTEVDLFKNFFEAGEVAVKDALFHGKESKKIASS